MNKIYTAIKRISLIVLFGSLLLSTGCNLYADHHDYTPFHETSMEVASKVPQESSETSSINSEPDPLVITGISVFDSIKDREADSSSAVVSVIENTTFSKTAIEAMLENEIYEGTYLAKLSKNTPENLSKYLANNTNESFQMTFKRQLQSVPKIDDKSNQGTAGDHLIVVSDISVNPFISCVSQAVRQRDTKFADTNDITLGFSDVNINNVVTKGTVDYLMWGNDNEIKKGYQQIFDGITIETYAFDSLTVKYKNKVIAKDIQLNELRKVLKKHCRDTYKDNDPANKVMNYMIDSSTDAINKVAHYIVFMQGCTIKKSIRDYNVNDNVNKIGDNSAVLYSKYNDIENALHIHTIEGWNYEIVSEIKKSNTISHEESNDQKAALENNQNTTIQPIESDGDNGNNEVNKREERLSYLVNELQPEAESRRVQIEVEWH